MLNVILCINFPFSYFKVELFEFLGAGAEGCKFGSIPRTTVTIANDDEYQDIINNMIAMTEAQLAELSLYQSDWGKQLKNAMLGQIFVLSIYYWKCCN